MDRLRRYDTWAGNSTGTEERDLRASQGRIKEAFKILKVEEKDLDRQGLVNESRHINSALLHLGHVTVGIVKKLEEMDNENL